jgi:hypothetical protein
MHPMRSLALLLALVGCLTIPVTVDAANRSSMDLTATYDVTAKLTWGSQRLDVRTRAHVRNTSGHGIERVDLNLVPARIGHLRELGVSVDGHAVDANVTGETVRVPLGRTLPDGDSVTIVVAYRATFRPGTGGHDFLFSSDGRIMSAMRWIPWVSRTTRYQPLRHGDPFVTVVSPRVRVTLDSNVPVRWGTSGHQVASSGSSRTFLAENVRDFNFTAARDYHVKRGWSEDGRVRITILTRTINASTLMTYARRALERFQKRIGKYPYPTYVIAESSGGIAMESPALTWIPAHTPNATLPFLITHETAHQWFYGVVGNDQTTNPFFDEAMAETMARSMFGFRASRCPTKRLDLTIYQYTPSCYYEQVYIQGSNFLNDLRRDMGSPAFWDVVRQFWRGHKYQIVTTKQLLEAFRRRAGDSVLPRYQKRFPSLY